MICIFRQSVYPFATSTLEKFGVQNHAAAILPVGKGRYPLYIRLGEPLGWWKARKISLPPG